MHIPHTPPPPVMTLPSANSAAVEWYCRIRLALESNVHTPVAGSQRSAAVMAWFRSTKLEVAALVSPPVARTEPSASTVALNCLRPLDIEPEAVTVGTNPALLSTTTEVLVGTFETPSSV